MHPKNIHNEAYNFSELIKSHSELKPFVFENDHGTQTIDFAKNESVFHLNKALLKHFYKIADWNIPSGYLCPPIPSRLDYLLYINDLIEEECKGKSIKGLDIGVGANCIYPIVGTQIFPWRMVGSDINDNAIQSAKANVEFTPVLKNKIEIRKQETNANIFEGIIKENEFFHFTICNPPFHTSEEEASKGSLRKLRNLDRNDSDYKTKKEFQLNFGGQANELWCNGGEALFIKRMIKQSVQFKSNVGWFTCIVSKKDNLAKIYKQLDKLKAERKTINMSQGNKKSRFIAWRFI
ncbi:MAG: 23S rRNA (adenine(1618)-N(6))-methyltransferase RlmF [Flavobacteriaceae bacterium]|nr:23S rRNA (adenine(1618)-N(6))-methyltransferase RlmF [Flavobacteriaceae bacterium]